MNTSNLLNFICKKNNISYIIFDDQFIVQQAFNAKIAIKSDIKEYLWEIVGMEDLILLGESFEIPMISRDAKYFDLSIEPYQENKEKNLFIAYLQQKSKETSEYADVIKAINKKTLIYDTSDEKKEGKYIHEINKRLITLHVDLEGKIRSINDTGTHFFNKDKDQINGKHFSEYFTPQKSKNKLQSTIFSAKDSMQNILFFHADIIPLKNKEGEIFENIIIAQDITYLKEVEKELQYAQEHDTLTGIGNRHFILKSLNTKIDKYPSTTIGVFDIDNFSAINEDYGSHAGDMVLKYFCEILEKIIDSSDILGRFYADKFVIIFDPTKNEDYIKTLLQKIELDINSKPLKYSEEDTIYFHISSIALSYPQDATSSKELIELALKKIKRKKFDKTSVVK